MITGKFDKIIENITSFATSAKNVHAVIIVGSLARETHPADENSDMDVILLVDDPDYFIQTDEWLKRIGTYFISFSEDSFGRGKERRVLFDGAIDVDFIFLFNLEDGFTREILSRGYRVLLDKNGLKIPKGQKKTSLALSELEFQNLTNDFWYHAVWTAKELARGEIWTAKHCLDVYMKSKLLSMIEHHVHAIRGAEYDTWHSGRFIEEWADSWIIEKLRSCFSRYDKEEVKSALIATMELFRMLTTQTSEKYRFDYPKSADEYATNEVEIRVNNKNGTVNPNRS